VRKFEATDGMTGAWPLIIALEGPPGGGKTFSALRLATGMARVRGSVPYIIDTEAGRSTKYRAKHEPAEPGTFIFQHIDFDVPFRSEDFLDAIRFCASSLAAAIIVDSMSDEHEGMLEWHEQLGDDDQFYRTTKQARNKLTRGILQITTPIIMCFRAREKTKIMKNEKGKNAPVRLGFVPIAPPELVHCCDLVALLPSRSNGSPVWRSDTTGEDFMLKLPQYLQPLIKEGQLDEATGEALARWSLNERKVMPDEPNRKVHVPEHITSPPHIEGDDAVPDAPDFEALLVQGELAANYGTLEFRKWWQSLFPSHRMMIGKQQLEEWKEKARLNQLKKSTDANHR
jgi:hypothetical protein